MTFTFVTIIGLISLYRSEQEINFNAEDYGFYDWLESKRHVRIKRFIESNEEMKVCVSALINLGPEDFKIKMDAIGCVMEASAIAEFSDLTKTLNSVSVLSEQSISILLQFKKSGATTVIRLDSYEGAEYMYFDAMGSIRTKYPKLAGADFQALVANGLLYHDYDSHGESLYIFTKAAARLIEGL